MMTVQQLIDTLMHGGNLDAVVVLASDGEGNAYSPLSDVDSEALYVSSSPWSGYVYTDDLEEVQAADEKAVRCVCLWPTN